MRQPSRSTPAPGGQLCRFERGMPGAIINAGGLVRVIGTVSMRIVIRVLKPVRYQCQRILPSQKRFVRGPLCHQNTGTIDK